MGLQQSKEALLYQQVIDGNIEAIKALHREGASLEWFDKEGKTALIVACTNPQLYDVAKTLIQLGANVNAYRPGGHAGTALHHAVKKGLDQTVKLLLSHGANPLALNDDHKTPVEVARVKGHCNVVRTIESHICFFSGWLRELYGPGFMEVFAPHLLSKKIWVVVLPCGSRNPRKPRNPRNPLRLELAMYNSLQDARPRTTIALWKAKVEEPKFYQPVPVVNIFDKSTKKKFRLASSDEGERQQLQWLSNACRGIPQVMHPTVLTNAHTSVVPPTMPPPNGDDVELAMAVNASLLLAREEMPQIMDSHSSPEVSNAIGWGSSADISSHNGWLSAEGAAPSEASSSGWLDEPAEEAYNGWGTSETESSSNRTEQNISAPGTTSVSLGNSANTSSHHGSGPIGGSAFSSKESCGGWLNNQSENVQNGWGMSETGSRSNQNNSTSVPLTHATPQTASVPSAPPVPEGADDGPIQYPSIDFSPVDWTMPNMDNKDSRTSQTKEDGGASSSCVICLDAPVEGACVPCGHMAGCMSCLNGIKAKEWGCPVCRAKIKQVIRLYAV